MAVYLYQRQNHNKKINALFENTEIDQPKVRLTGATMPGPNSVKRKLKI
jgi:hypothetical protein